MHRCGLNSLKFTSLGNLFIEIYEPELVKYDKQNEEYEVEKILKSRTRSGKKEYLIKWRSYSSEFNSWIPAENLKN